jgi:hypothetical protein
MSSLLGLKVLLVLLYVGLYQDDPSTTVQSSTDDFHWTKLAKLSLLCAVLFRPNI